MMARQIPCARAMHILLTGAEVSPRGILTDAEAAEGARAFAEKRPPCWRLA